MQVVTGCLMVVFGVLSMLHEASLSSVGAGLWSGAMAMGNGVVGLMASLNGCLSPNRTLSPLSVTIYLALCLVSVGVSNLAIILTAIGLLKDSQKPYYIIPKDKVRFKLKLCKDLPCVLMFTVCQFDRNIVLHCYIQYYINCTAWN